MIELGGHLVKRSTQRYKMVRLLKYPQALAAHREVDQNPCVKIRNRYLENVYVFFLLDYKLYRT